jgi:hypothetical protein
MKFLGYHGDLLSQYLTEKAIETYNQLKFFCTHNNKYVRFAAFPAMEKFYGVVSAEIVSGKRNPESDRQTFTVCLTIPSQLHSNHLLVFHPGVLEWFGGTKRWNSQGFSVHSRLWSLRKGHQKVCRPSQMYYAVLFHLPIGTLAPMK